VEKLEQDYSDLCDRVEKIDAEAARYMRSDDCLNLYGHIQDRHLCCAFWWEGTPQGHDSWERIDYELREATK